MARAVSPDDMLRQFGRFALDARTPALLVAAVLVWRKAPFVVVALAAAATAALLRLVA